MSTTHPAPLALFTMGLPGSGKTYVAAQRYDLASMATVDPDAIKASHPDYDPKNPAALHAWSNVQAEALLASTLAAGTDDVFVDGTGTNAEKMVRRMTAAKAAGYRVELLFVSVPLQVALDRNAARERTVPEHVVREKALDIATSFEIASAYADTIHVIQNS